MFILMLLILSSCKEQNPSEQNNGKGAGNTENYVDEQDKSATTNTGQNIGSTADSTTIDGERGNRSNN